jgi:glycosyltransferase involved in cell wall biosynthesis
MARRLGTTDAQGGRPIPDISVVIPTRDRRELLLEALGALGSQTLATRRFEVIPVVDGSTDGTAGALADLPAPYVLRPIIQPAKGRAAACNAGIRAAKGAIVVLLDDDMLPTAGFLEAHVRAHVANDHVGVLGPVPIRPEIPGSAAGRYVAKKFDRHLSRLSKGAPIGFRELYTGNFSASVADLHKVGLFDEQFTTYGNEDGELGIRLLEAAVELRYDPAPLAWQRFTKTFADLARDNEAKGRTAVMLARRHPNALAELKLSARNSRTLRLGRATLLSLTRIFPRMPQAVIGAFGLVERVSPSLAEYLCPAILDYFYWRGARAEIEVGDWFAEDAKPDEPSRNARLRRADWRFLLPDPNPRVTVCFDSALRGAAEHVSGSVVSPAEAAGDCDLAVLVDPDPSAVASALMELRPGGVCYAEWSPLRRTRRRVAERVLTSAGFVSVRCYWPWPRRAAAHAWLPLDSPAAVRFYFATRAARRSLPTRLAHAAGHLVAALAIRIGVAGTIVAVAVKPAWDSERRQVGAEADSLGLLLTGGPRSISKAVRIVFSGREPLPRYIEKMNRTPEARTAIMREVEMLRFLEHDRPNLPGVPRVISVDDTDGIARIAETPIPGKPLHGDLRRETLARYTGVVTEWTLRLAGLEGERSSAVPVSDVVDPIETRFKQAYGAVITERDWLDSRAILAGLGDVPAVPEHRDLGPWNMIVNGGRLGVVDWESAVPRGLPGLDLIYFLLYAAGYATGVRRHRQFVDVYREVRDPSTPIGALAKDALLRYCGVLGIDPRQLPALHLLAWMVHAASDRQREVEDAGGGRGRHIPDQRLFVPLWRAELATARRA